MPIRFILLGHPLLVRERTGDCPLAASRPMQLLAYLAVNGSWQGRGHLAHLFWPDKPESAARSNLRNLLSKVQDAAPDLPLQSTRQSLCLQMSSDLADFDAAIQRRDWETAARVGASDLLSGFESYPLSEPYLQWLRAERQARVGKWVLAVKALVGDALQPIELREELAQALEKRCPFDEDVVQLSMRLAYDLHRSAAAASIHEAFKVRMKNELGVAPSVEFERFALQAAQAHSAARPLTSTPTNGAASLKPGWRSDFRKADIPRDPLTGRRRELRELRGLVQDDSKQLITLTGPGGVGKSALITGLHKQLIDDVGIGAFRVDVSAAASTKEAMASIAAALNLTVSPGADEESVLSEALSDSHWFIIIDGAEQHGFAASLTQLLCRCPRTRWLIASRHRLHLDCEHVMRLEGFPLPDAEETDPEILNSNDGVRFLTGIVAKAGEASHPVRDAAAMAAIVRAVEGLPLALKLLGQLTPVLTLQQLLQSVLHQEVASDRPDEWIDPIELLPALLASFKRSWESLSHQQQGVLARLSTIPGDFDTQAARRVAKTELPVIMSLVDRSLVRATGAGRLSVHASIRLCALAVSPQSSEDVQADYVAHYTERLRLLAMHAKNRSTRPLNEF